MSDEPDTRTWGERNIGPGWCPAPGEPIQEIHVSELGEPTGPPVNLNAIMSRVYSLDRLRRSSEQMEGE